MSCTTRGPKIAEGQSGTDYWWKRWLALKTLLYDREDKLRLMLSDKHAEVFHHPIIHTNIKWRCQECDVEYKEVDILVLWDTIINDG